jgi:endonuclease YncB( thermonuclease family)
MNSILNAENTKFSSENIDYTMAKKPHFYGTKTGKVVEAILDNSLHTWTDILKHTGLSENELNYHLAQLFQEDVIKKDRGKYYIKQDFKEKWNAYSQLSNLKMETPKSSKNILQMEKTRGFNLTKNKVILILLIFSISLNLLTYVNINKAKFENNQLQSEINEYIFSIEELESNITSIQLQQENAQETIENLNDEISRLNILIQELEGNPNTDNSPSSSSSSSTTREVTIERISYCSDVIDGDTLYLSTGTRVRLADIDAPDSNETGWKESSEALEDLILGKVIYLDVSGEADVFGRLVCVVYVSQGSGYLNVNEKLVNDGYAVSLDYDNEFSPTQWIYFEVLDTSDATTDSEDSSSESTDTSESDGSKSSSSSTTYEGPFWGSKNSNIYHKPSCYWAQQIKSSNLIIFSTRSEAEAAGYKPCKVCKP